MPDITVSSCCIIYGSSDRLFFSKRNFSGFPINISFHFGFYFCFQLLTFTVDHFDSIIIVRVMACRNHDSAVKIFCPHHIGNTRCGSYMKQINIRTRSGQSCYQRILKHVTASSCIFSDHNLCFVAFSIVPSEKSSHFVGVFHGQIHICFSSKTICTKILTHNTNLTSLFKPFFILQILLSVPGSAADLQNS